MNSAMQKASVNVTSKLIWRQMKGIECMKDMKRSGLVKKTLMNIKKLTAEKRRESFSFQNAEGKRQRDVQT